MVEWEPLPELLLEHVELLKIPHIFDYGFVGYGVAQDGWMGRTAILSLSPPKDARSVRLSLESYAPDELHPITLTFEDEQGQRVHVYHVAASGASAMQLDLRELFHETDHGYLKLVCDTTFCPHELNSANPDRRELGVRMVSGRYV